MEPSQLRQCPPAGPSPADSSVLRTTAPPTLKRVRSGQLLRFGLVDGALVLTGTGTRGSLTWTCGLSTCWMVKVGLAKRARRARLREEPSDGGRVTRPRQTAWRTPAWATETPRPCFLYIFHLKCLHMSLDFPTVSAETVPTSVSHGPAGGRPLLTSGFAAAGRMR